MNIQGLTNAKQMELQGLICQQGILLCLTETQQKYDKIDWSEDICKIESMRTMNDKKGGGLLIACKKRNWVTIEQLETKSRDILYAMVRMFDIKMHMVLVYFSIPKAKEDKERNSNIKKEIELIIDKAGENSEAAMVLGDFNGHIDVLGQQKEDENGRIVLDWVNNYGMQLLNLDAACEGIYTWSRNEQRSAIDFVLVNRKCYRYEFKI